MNKIGSIKKVLLVVPNFSWRDADTNILWHYIPYNLCMLASMIEADYQVQILDANKEKLSLEEFSNRVKNINPQVVGVGILMDYFGRTGHMVMEAVKKVSPEIITVLGGVYATTNSMKAIKDINIDYLIAGEGEYAFRDLLYAINVGEVPKLSGIYYRKDGKIVGEGLTVYAEQLDELPFPAYHLIDFPSYAVNVERKGVDRPAALPYARIVTSRGCIFNCCFCQVKNITGNKFRFRSAENVLAEIDWLIKEYRIKSIIFDDDNWFIDRKRAKDILEGLAKRNIKHKALNIAAFYLDDELLELLKNSGCDHLALAVETGSVRVMNEIIHKPLDLEQAKRVVKKAKELGIYVVANFIVGFPGETWNEIMETIKFIEEFDADYSKIFNATPLPHTKMYEIAKSMNAIIDGYDSENIDWRRGWIETDEFTANDLTILRAYEWDRINFTCPQKRAKTIEMMGITEEELDEMRRHTRKQAAKLIAANMAE